jgi:RNA polymerase sigma-70 factor, ECF subfamily
MLPVLAASPLDAPASGARAGSILTARCRRASFVPDDPSLPSRPLTVLLAELRQGDAAARDELLAVVYPELRRIAAHYMRQERPEHTLHTTALVNEAYVRLFGRDADWKNRAHFFAAVAREMRHILVDHARARNAQKRPNPRVALSLSDAALTAPEPSEDVVALDEALTRLESVDPRASRVVELRYFTGLTEPEAAEALGISTSTLKRDWQFAKAWLFDQLRPDDPAPSP